MACSENSKMRRESADFIGRDGNRAADNLGKEFVHREEDSLGCHVPQRDRLQRRNRLIFEPIKSVSRKGGFVINTESHRGEGKGCWQSDRLQRCQSISRRVVAPL